MAVRQQVNKAVRAAFPGKDIEAVFGSGYVYFAGADGFDKIPSLYVNPRSVTTADLARWVIEQINDSEVAYS
jgi:hypothetical protein